MKKHVLLTLFALLMCSVLCAAQQYEVKGKTPAADDPVAQSVFPPELVMKYHNEIGLDDNQTKAMKEAIQKVQGRFLDVQWEMQSETEKLARLLNTRPVDESATLAQLDRVLNLEREVKKAQIALLIRIKNLLTEAQQNKLMELRRQAW